jgi:hypothetical protein
MQLRDLSKPTNKGRRSAWYQNNKEKLNKCSKEWYQKNKEKIKEYNKNRKEYLKQYKAEYWVANKERITKYRDINKDKKSRYMKEYVQTNYQHIRKRLRDHERNKYNTDMSFRLLKNLRRRIGRAIRYGSKSATTEILIGCDMSYLKLYLEKQFVEGMTWDNYGEWHIDHTIPCASFDLSIREEQHKCFNYTNLQPLWAIDNIKKSSKMAGNNGKY